MDKPRAQHISLIVEVLTSDGWPVTGRLDAFGVDADGSWVSIGGRLYYLGSQDPNFIVPRIDCQRRY
jgi:hypothetical protein